MAKIRQSQVRKIKEARAAYHEAVESGDLKAARRADAVYTNVSHNATQEEFDQATK